MRKLTLIFLLLLPCALYAQKDTLLNLRESEELFLKNNLDLLAAKFNVKAAEAAIIQARIWDNPNLSFGFNAYNPERNKFLDIGAQGEKSAGFDQLIYLGGKKRNEVALAQTNAELAKLEFSDLLRNLKLELRQTFFGLYYQNLTYQSIRRQLADLDSLVVAYQTQVQKGNIALKDLVRLQSLALTLKNQKTQLYENIVDFQTKLNLLTGLSATIVPDPTKDELSTYQIIKHLPVDSLTQLAFANRTDLKITQKQVDASNLNLKWQKSKSIPDVTVGALWDQRGGTFENEVGINLGIPLPLWNRNQGNIKMARAQLDEVSVLQKQLANKISSEVSQSLKKWKEAIENYRILNKSSLQNLENVQNGIFLNFRNGNLSLIEFTDFMESYHSTLMQYHQFGQNLVNSCEQINYITNSKIF